MKTLYTFKKDDGTVGYGVHIGTNSDNMLVLEEKGTNSIVIRSTSEVEEVVPFTFECTDQAGTKITYTGPTTVAVGDLLVSIDKDKRPKLLRVTRIDTKQKQNVLTFKGSRVVTTDLV